MPTEGGFSFANFLTDVVTVFLFVVWFWLLIIVLVTYSGVRTFPDGARPYG
jgi:hypothetical protein